jgi:chloramphenicol-sensitive protein RarD
MGSWDQRRNPVQDSTKGVVMMIAACTVWGLSPLFYALLTHVPPFEVLSYRGLWSLAFFTTILLLQNRLGDVFRALRVPRNLMIIALAAVMISMNWFGFIFAISNGLALEASLGYYVFPLFAVILGRFAFAEKLSTTQGVAVGIAAIAVLILAVGLGVTPWLALMLAATFSVYGTIKKKLDLGPVVSVTAEVLLLSPIFAFWILSQGGATGHTIGTHLLLALSGPLTATPLIMFSYAAKRARMSTIGLVQYVNPTLQFGCAVFVFSEPFTQWHAIAFPMIWLALAIYSIALLHQDRAARKSTSKAGTSSVIVT